MHRTPKYALDAHAWERLLATLPHFHDLFALTEVGFILTDPEYQTVARKIWDILSIPPGTEHSAAALVKICPCAQYARGLLEAVEDGHGGRLLYEIIRH